MVEDLRKHFLHDTNQKQNCIPFRQAPCRSGSCTCREVGLTGPLAVACENEIAQQVRGILDGTVMHCPAQQVRGGTTQQTHQVRECEDNFTQEADYKLDLQIKEKLDVNELMFLTLTTHTPYVPPISILNCRDLFGLFIRTGAQSTIPVNHFGM